MNHPPISDRFHFIVVTEDLEKIQEFSELIRDELRSNQIAVISENVFSKTVEMVQGVTQQGFYPVVFLDPHFRKDGLKSEVVKKILKENPRAENMLPIGLEFAKKIFKECPDGGMFIPIGSHPQFEHIEIKKIIKGGDGITKSKQRGNKWRVPHVWGVRGDNTEIDLIDFRKALNECEEGLKLEKEKLMCKLS